MIRIVAIDDNNDNLISLNAIIKDAFPDSIIYTALDGQKGIKLSIEKDPDVILLDILMPEMDGFEVCRRLKQDDRLRDIPVIFLTAIKERKESRIEALEIGADAFLAKPIDFTELTAQIRAMVKIKNANRQKRDEKERLNFLVAERTRELEQGRIEMMKLLTECQLAQGQIKTLGKAIEQGPSSIVITDENRNINFVNDKFVSSTQYTIDDVRGKKPRIFNLGHLPEKDYNNLLKTLKKGKTWRGEVLNRRKDQTKFWEEITISILMNPDGSISNYVLCMNDISEKKQMLDDLIKAKEKAEESDHLKSAFLANMSHEIRTPLNCIIGFSDLMLEPDFDKSKVADYAHMINSSGVSMLTIINDILDISKIEVGQVCLKKDVFSANKLIENIKEEQFNKVKEKGLNLEIDTFNSNVPIFINSDEYKIKQILTNLVCNSIKFSKKGCIKIGFSLKENFVQFYVKDMGIGIPKEFCEKIFERFIQVESDYTREYGGNGLGLAISKSYVNLLGGKIWVESEVGTGSVFYFTIPKGEID
jgi:PAS domain S-box-containing protein